MIQQLIRKYYTKYQGHRFRVARSKGLIELPYAPFQAWVEPTNRCNLKCVMCPQSKGLSAPQGFMDMKLYLKIIRELRAIKMRRISLFMGGEPLLHRQIVEMARIAREHGISVRLHTNATLLTEEISRGLLDSGAVQEISLSFDAEKPEYYEKLRAGAKYEKTKSNILKFLALKKAAGKKTPQVIVQVIKERNPDGSPVKVSADFMAQFHDLPVDVFKGIPFHNFGGTFDGSGKARNNFTPCSNLWKSFNISWDGVVVACCVDSDRKLVLGDMRDQSIMEIWNGEKIKRLRKLMAERRLEELGTCKECDACWS